MAGEWTFVLLHVPQLAEATLVPLSFLSCYQCINLAKKDVNDEFECKSKIIRCYRIVCFVSIVCLIVRIYS